MADSTSRLSPASHADAQGIFPCQGLRSLVAAGMVSAEPEIDPDQIQPASLDLRLGRTAYRVQASFLPGENSTIADKLPRLKMYELDLSQPTVLERGCIYLVPLAERLALPPDLSGVATPKSSTGRLDIFTRLIADGANDFERIPLGYQGPLYIEICPRTFSVLVRAGDRLNQIRIRRGDTARSDRELEALHASDPIVFSNGRPVDPALGHGLWLSVGLEPLSEGAPIAYRARHHAPLLDISRVGHYRARDFWEPLYADPEQGLILTPDAFYILASNEQIRVPPNCTAEMIPYDTTVGEFRAHYAGFFDPGFGCRTDGALGNRAVLEVRTHEVQFMLEHGQRVGRLVYESVTERPEVLYGEEIGSHYANQSLSLAKQFIMEPQ
ncbi:MAG: 2'-deoxycytidine 5'-triphosphate deaminase [Alphaproteobacteria bacterium]|nr:2'-deoxycytidine 5'-triphosphate deaminase [Alphaproteobacteria bacterium]